MLVVQKYGGTSVGTVERIREVARRCIATQAQAHDVVVIVSAMSGETNRLLALAKQVNDDPPPEYSRELDVIAATGEQVSVGLVSLAIQKADLGRDQSPPGAGQAGQRRPAAGVLARARRHRRDGRAGLRWPRVARHPEGRSRARPIASWRWPSRSTTTRRRSTRASSTSSPRRASRSPLASCRSPSRRPISGETNRLLALAKQVNDDPPPEYSRELDVIAATGEQVSVGLVSLAIQKADLGRDQSPPGAGQAGQRRPAAGVLARARRHRRDGRAGLRWPRVARHPEG